MSAAHARIGIVCNSLKGGGAEGNAVLLARSWPRTHGVSVLVAVSGRGDLPSRELVGIDVRVLGIDDWPRPRAMLRTIRALRRLAMTDELTHLVLNSYGLNQTVLLAIRLGLLPRHLAVAVVEHLSLRGRLRRRLPSAVLRGTATGLLRWLYRAEVQRVAVSEGVAAENEVLLGLAPGAFTVIRNGIDRDRLARLRTTDPGDGFSTTFATLPRPIVLGIGRLEAQKNFPLLVEAFARAAPDEGSLVILGEGSLRERLQEDIHDQGLSARVHMPGRLDNPLWYLDRSDLFVLSSDFEGFPIVLLEALACGIRVVATDCPWGPAEMLEDVGPARLVPIRDVDAMAAAIAASLSDSDSRPIGRIEQDAHTMAAAYAQLFIDRRVR
jgi:glycosyltransferase involved in cell wall biosynthesis